MAEKGERTLYNDYQENYLTPRFLYFMQILCGIIFISLGIFSIIFNSWILNKWYFQIIAISVGLFSVIHGMLRIIKWQNLRINENGIFPYERSLNELYHRNEAYILFKDIDKIIRKENTIFTKGEIIIYLNNGKKIKINLNLVANISKFISILGKNKEIKMM